MVMEYKDGTRGLTFQQKKMLAQLDDNKLNDDEFVMKWEYFDNILEKQTDSYGQVYHWTALSDVFHYVENNKKRYKDLKGL